MIMNCSRCQGLLVRDHFLDFDGTIGHMWASGYRCMNCGNVVDPVIEQHRLARAQQPPVLVGNGEGYPMDAAGDIPSVMQRAA